MTNTAVNLEIDRSFCRLTQGSVNFKIDGSYSSNKFIIVSSAGRVHALYKKLETKGFINFHPRCLSKLRKSTPFPTIRPGGEGGNRSYLAQVAGYTFLGTFRYADFENRWWNVQILGKLWFFRAQSWDIKAWKVLKTSVYLTSIQP